MACKYLYIDDNTKEQAEGTISGLTAGGGLEIEHINPSGNWDDQIQYIFDNIIGFHGLILDQRLDQAKGLNGHESKYRGTSLAQEIRVLSKEGKVKDLPIVLLSAEANITGSFDSTGVDLFDFVVSKESVSEIFNETRLRLIALASGYEKLLKIDKAKVSESSTDVLAIPEERLKKLDPRFVSKLEKVILMQPHLISNFLIEEILQKSGLLINEHLLAARLGVDIETSKDWPMVLELFEKAAYTGLFCEGWTRWWTDDVELLWATYFERSDLRLLEAAEKVALIQALVKKESIVAAVKLQYARSNTFWTICAGTGKPIDITDGLLIDNQDDLYPWQDRQYVSHLAALQRINSATWKDVSALEKPKLDKLQTIYKRERVR